jgi:hypothetical protein
MRAVNRIAAGVLGVVLVVVGMVGTAELAFVAAGRPAWPPWLDEWLGRWRTTSIGDRRVLGLAIGAGLVGLLVVVAQVRRWRPDRVPVGDARQGVWWLSRRGVERRTAATVDALLGVHKARTDIRGGGRHWRIRLRAQATPDAEEPVERALRAELRRMDLPEEAPVEVALRPPRRVA